MRRGEEEEEEESGSKAEIIWLTESIPFSFSTLFLRGDECNRGESRWRRPFCVAVVFVFVVLLLVAFSVSFFVSLFLFLFGQRPRRGR